MEYIAHTFENPAFWVGVAFFIFVGIIIYVKVPASIGASLDERAAKISAQLDEARTLREEAQALLAQYQRKQRDAAKDAEEMVAQAKEESELFALEAGKNLEDILERRSRAATEKIAQAEAQAVKEVRAAAVSVAIGAAEKVVREHLGGKELDGLLDDAIKELDKRLH
ncbi:MAG: F0F1 ATP synthase subunit B [Proteobacteria bacterium]|nr:F0F1 ATP synthase subunit B [Pseudomonadota bacterium]